MSSRISSFLILITSIFLLLALIFGIILGYNHVTFDTLGILSIFSAIFFIIILFLSLKNDSFFLALLPFVMLAFPAPVNDFFPSFPLGLPSEKGGAVFSFFTHIDIYILLGIFRKLLAKSIVSIDKIPTINLLIVLLLISFAINISISQNESDFYLMLAGSFQIRYLIEIFLLLSLFDYSKYEKEIFVGLALSVTFLLLEAFINTSLKEAERLSSGSLGMNTFGNVIGSIFVFLMFFRNPQFKIPKFKLIRLALMFICLLVVLLTKNRISIIAIILSVIFVKGYVFGSLTRFIKIGILGVCMVVLFFILFSGYIPNRYNVIEMSSKIQFNEISIDPEQILSIEKSWETNAIITRLKLFATSVKMIIDNPIIGIGSGRWNYYKYEYGFLNNILIDSHNGYLSILSQYGCIGILLIYFIYISPISLLKNGNKNSTTSIYYTLGVVNIFFLIADLSNSGVYKHQVFAFLVFTAIVGHYSKKKNHYTKKKIDSLQN